MKSLLRGCLLLIPWMVATCAGEASEGVTNPPDAQSRTDAGLLDAGHAVPGADASVAPTHTIDAGPSHMIEAGTNDLDSGTTGPTFDPDAAVTFTDVACEVQPWSGDGGVDAGLRVEGDQINAWGTPLCLDLSGEQAYPGACSSITHPEVVVGEEPRFSGELCRYGYQQGRLSHFECEGNWVFSECALTQPLESCWDTTDLTYHDEVTLTYSGDDLVTVLYSEFGEWIDGTSELNLPKNEAEYCDFYEEPPCHTASLTDEQERHYVEYYVPSFSAPSVDPLREEAGQPCTLSGSIDEGEIVQRCAEHEYRFVYSAEGKLTLRIVRDLDSRHEPLGRGYLYDRAGNLRYIVWKEFYSETRWTLVVEQYQYDCW